jgi:hypothetical protein
LIIYARCDQLENCVLEFGSPDLLVISDEPELLDESGLKK